MSCASLPYMSIGAGVVVTVTFQQIDSTPYPKNLGYGSGYKEPFWIRKATKSYVKVHKGTFMELSDSHKISQEKRDFKISDVLITAWSRVQVLPGPYRKKTPFRVSFLYFRRFYSPSSAGSWFHRRGTYHRAHDTLAVFVCPHCGRSCFLPQIASDPAVCSMSISRRPVILGGKWN